MGVHKWKCPRTEATAFRGVPRSASGHSMPTEDMGTAKRGSQTEHRHRGKYTHGQHTIHSIVPRPPPGPPFDTLLLRHPKWQLLVRAVIQLQDFRRGRRHQTVRCSQDVHHGLSQHGWHRGSLLDRPSGEMMGAAQSRTRAQRNSE